MPATLASFEQYATDIMQLRYSHTVQGRKESWLDISKRVCNAVLDPFSHWSLPQDIKQAIFEIIKERKFIPGGRILSQAGRQYHQTDNCYCLTVEDSREAWADLAHKCTMMFMSGGGVGCDYSNLRPYGSMLKRSGGISSGPIPAVQMVNSIAAAVRQGGERRGACYASLAWDHDDITEFIKLKAYHVLAHTNISVRFDTLATDEYNIFHLSSPAYPAFISALKYACQYGDPGFQFDNDQQILRNACTEIISDTDSDSCCLGSVNLAAISDLQELSDVTNLAVLFLLCNTLYTDTPTVQVKAVKEQNRRIGLGLMGVAEWFVQRQLPYGFVKYTNDKPMVMSTQIAHWLRIWSQTCGNAAIQWSDKLSINRPVATRAIAPTGTISIVGGHTTPGIEPIFHTAYQRTYNTLKEQQFDNGYKVTTVIDPVVQKLLMQGYNVDNIDTAYTLSQSTDGIERRIAFQAFCQQYVDNAISSTVNLPQYVSGIEDNIAPILLRYLPQLRGITFYPDGAHDNQPVVPVDIDDALRYNNTQLHSAPSCKGEGCGV